MRNIVGQIPRGKDFYQRDRIIKRIYRRLEAGNHIFLSAPRRAGKTSIMRYMEENPEDGFAFVYLNVEDVQDIEEYFRLLSEELLESQAVSRLLRISDRAKRLFTDFAEVIKSIKVWGVELDPPDKEQPKYSKEFEKLLRNVAPDELTIVILVDEFPVALERIEKAHGSEQAKHFLHLNRGIRQRADQGVLFTYTGSIGLPNIARKLEATATINDLNIVKIPPLDREDAKEFATRLLHHYNVKYEKSAIDSLLDRIQWLTPFFIQLCVQVMIDEYEEKGALITKELVDKVILKSSTHGNSIYFENYYTRLDKTLSEVEATLAKRILQFIAEQHQASIEELKELGARNDILDILEFDGYIYAEEDHFRFNSPILRDWWVKHAG